MGARLCSSIAAALAAVGLAMLAFGVTAAGGAGQATCKPTRTDALGPFYEPGAPVRSSVGKGYTLRGIVRSARTCRPIRRARIEFWLVNPGGEYDDAHRATVIASRTGRYRFTSNKPVGYSGRPPHIHIRVTARGFRTLVTQHYPRPRQTAARFQLVLVRR
jgi:protocatechuate 3,4-dioxygenase beta subunit